MLQKKKVKRLNNDVKINSNAVEIQNKKKRIRNSVSVENENNFLKSNNIASEFKNKSNDNVAYTKTKSKTKKKPLKCKSHEIKRDKKPQTVEIQPKDINKNKQLQKKQLNNIVQENKVNTKLFLNGKNSNFKEEQKLIVPLKIAAAPDLIGTKSPKKRKSNSTIVNEHSATGLNIKVKNLDFDKADELIVNAKKKKLNQVYQEEDKEEQLFRQENKNRAYLKKQKLKRMLDKNDVTRNSIKVNGRDLRTRMLERLKGKHLRSILSWQHQWPNSLHCGR